jgi:hypothetical protein
MKAPSVPKPPTFKMDVPKAPEFPDPRKEYRKLMGSYGKGQAMWGKWAQKVAPTSSNGGREQR